MCLERVDSKSEKQCNIEKIRADKDEYITLWKLFRVDEKGYLIAQYKKYQFYEGKNTARSQYITDLDGNRERNRWQYTPGFHLFTNKEDAEYWRDHCNSQRQHGTESVIYPVKVKKEWITDMGIQAGKRVVVSKHIVIEE